ncbi:MAG: hypothetical protein JEY94_03805 [Melioribacteraceae bacterium]|nr:hypothetical protein [Melioribacteraceae bacterium]
MSEMKELIEVFTKISESKEMDKLFSEIFTEAERDDFASRWGLMKDLQNGMSQRSIAKKRHISLCKITRGAKLLKDDKSITKNLIKTYC